MKKITFALMTNLMFVFVSFSQPIPVDSLYFGQTPPGSIPKKFAPGLVSLPGRNEACITFSPDGKSIIFYVEFYPNPADPFIMYANYQSNGWTAPDTISFAQGRRTGEPFLAFNGTRLYMFASNAINQQGSIDLCYSEKQGNTWTIPTSLGNPPNSESAQYHPCVVNDSSTYFSSQSGYICRSQYSNGVYQNKVILPTPINYIGTQTWGDPYVSKNETYMIFKSIRSEGYGQHDIYISYRKPDNSWTNPKNLGNKINTPYDETSGDITPDGNYMTYGSNKDLYWVSTSFIDSLRYTNFAPYLKNKISNQIDTVGQMFNFTFPDSTFFDDDGNNTLSYIAKLTNGNPLPSWLTFDSISRTFSGISTVAEILNIKLIAIDTAGAYATTTFKITTKVPVSTNNIDKKNIQILPNPTNGILKISLGSINFTNAYFEICSTDGKTIVKNTLNNSAYIDLSDKPKGIYILKLHIDNETFINKICVN